MKRNTVQKTAINDVLHRATLPLSAEELLTQARKTAPKMNLATLYRNLKSLVEEGTVTRVTHPQSGVLYEKTTAEQFT